MLILTIRTDKPEAELGLFEDSAELGYIVWEAHRELSDTIHHKMRELLQSRDKDWGELEGIVCFQGPGSFTGLRIGISVANTLAASLGVPIVGKAGDDWLQKGLQSLGDDTNEKMVIPEYGAPPNTTLPRK